MKHPILVFSFCCLACFYASFNSCYAQPSASKNYILEVVHTQATVVEIPFTTENSRRKITYFDGFGRTIQTIGIGATPDKKDLVSVTEYDIIGREHKQLLPFKSHLSAGQFIENAATTQYYYYLYSAPTSISSEYNQTIFENNPLSRPIKQGFPGWAWNPENPNGHPIQNRYSYNDDLSYYNTQNQRVPFQTDLINMWQIDANGTVSKTQKYNNGTLMKKSTTDENGTTTLEFTDFDGKLICTKIVLDRTNLVTTQYIYDHFGLLRYVLPPNVSNIHQFNEQDALFLKNIYGYHYDGYKRVIEKKIPGKAGWESIVYNNADLPIFTQTPQQKAEGYWMFTKYDNMGRTIITGKYISSETRAQLQIKADKETNLYERFNSSGASTCYGYTNACLPIITDKNLCLTVLFFDNYDYLTLPEIATKTQEYKRYLPILGQTNTPIVFTQGMNTGSMVQVLGSYQKLKVVPGVGVGGQTVNAQYMVTQTYFNEDYRPWIVVKENYAQGIDIYENSYTFAGEIIHVKRKTYTNKKYNQPAADVITTLRYDHEGRALETILETKFPLAKTIILNKLEYNDLGQLKTKNLVEIGSNNYVETQNYSYHSRGWLKSIRGKYFEFMLHYEENRSNSDMIPNYNGNISQMSWSNVDDNLTRFKNYSYDKLNRLLAGVGSGGGNESGIQYDMMGNILKLVRDAQRLDYVYDGNQLKELKLTKTGQHEVRHYGYNLDGSMVSDGRASLEYNELNLIGKATKNGQSLYYTYDALGNKLRFNQSTKQAERYYDEGLEFVGTGTELVLDRYGVSDGYLSGDFKILYIYLADHLGNVRRVISRNLETGVLNVNEQKLDYYPFGMVYNKTGTSGNKYQFNSKEYQEDLGFYDYGARMYDAEIGRWMAVDPLGEKRIEWTQYNIMRCNPIKNIDPTGMLDEYFIKKNGEIDKIENDDKFDKFYIEKSSYDYNGNLAYNFELVGQYKKISTSNGTSLVKFPNSGVSFEKNIKTTSNYIQPELAAAILGASIEFFNETGLKIQINQLNSAKGGHSSHSGNGTNADIRYVNTKGNINEPVWTNGKKF